ncbi:MAG: Do family serine endopeptidase [Tidjanibacter sp.]|nr:Do family serine endopeptidase [Tidjanibacter sp.]MBQ5807385.1 Do family serine endopeptidase [Tidjanibacter sp.]
MKQAFIAAAALIGAAAIGGLSAAAVISSQQQEAQPTEVVATNPFDEAANNNNHFVSYSKERYPDLTYAAENAVKAVVNIEVVMTVKGSVGFDPFLQFFGIPQGYYGAPTREAKAGGSGVLITDDGYIVTNHHVVENATKVKVRLNDGRTYDAEIVGSDPTSEVALIKIDDKGLPFLKFGSSDNLRLGEWVLAIGSPFDLPSTITAGIVSAKARNLGAIPSQYSIESFIQTDAAVNPGNSGGALVNTAGELVGINTLIKSETGSYVGYSFAVPSTIVKKVVMDLKEYGVVQRALLGVQYQEVTNDFVEQYGKEYGISEIGGAWVAEVTKGGAAEAAGIQKGDVITAIDGVKIDSSARLSEIVAQHRPNDKIKIEIKREGKVKQIEVVLRNTAGKTAPVSKDDLYVAGALGGDFADLGEKAARQLGIKGGVRVTAVKEGGFLAKARVRPGFVITHVNEKAVASVADLERISEKVTSVDGIYPQTGRSASYSLVE